MSRKPKIFLGLDLSLTSPGMSTIRKEGKKLQLLDYQAIKTDSKEDWFIRRKKIQEYIISFVQKHNPDVVIVENYSYGSVNGRELSGEVHGIVLYKLIESGFPLERIFRRVSPGQLKKFIAQKGNASKKEIVKSVNELFNLNLKNSEDDKADAIVLAFIGYCMFYYQEIEPILTEKQEEVMTKILKTMEEYKL